MSRSKYTAKDRRIAVDMYKQGVPLAEIKAVVGASPRSIRLWARDAGCWPRRTAETTWVYSKATRDHAVRMYLDGASMLQIGAKTGASDFAIRSWVLDAGHQLRTSGGRAQHSREVVVRTWRRLGSQKAAAEVLGCTPANVHYHLVRVGLRPKDR